ncbi:MAG: sulfotransferase [Terricaulis sp.]
MLAARLQLHDAAAEAARRLHAETPPSHMTAVILARALEAAGCADEGATALMPWAQTGQLVSQERFLLARLLSFANRLEEAEAELRALMVGAPDDAFAWALLAQGKRFASGDHDIVKMEELRKRIGQALPHQRAAVSYGLGKAYVDIGDDAAAAKALAEAAAAKSSLARYDGDSIEQAERGALELMGEDREFGRVASAAESARALFVVGSPRSGTTLVEHILASHSQVMGGGEHNFMWLASKGVGDISSSSVRAYLARALAGGQTKPWDEMGRRYLDLADARFGVATRFTDKQLSNHWRLGLIRRALPHARIVWVRRDPLDIAWSCWRTNFNAESGWACSPLLLARYIASYRRLMSAWVERQEGAIITVQYEDLVQDPDREIRRLLTAVGLRDEAQARQPHRQERAVSTASFAQVRAPISASRVGAEKRFPKATLPLREALRAVGL